MYTVHITSQRKMKLFVEELKKNKHGNDSKMHITKMEFNRSYHSNWHYKKNKHPLHTSKSFFFWLLYTDTHKQMYYIFHDSFYVLSLASYSVHISIFNISVYIFSVCVILSKHLQNYVDSPKCLLTNSFRYYIAFLILFFKFNCRKSVHISNSCFHNF